ncbi:MAG: hypothetical protein HY921_12120 [Elusimicrobia bacterium]|nr:hypothetical protein [Elusimicrobiota bacterium]
MGILLRLLALYLGGLPVFAQTSGATHLLSRGPGAEAAALGNSIIPTVNDPAALYWNPAGLAHAGGAVMGEHLFLYDGARYDFLGLSVPSPVGTFGLGALQLDRGNIVARNAIDDPGTKVSNSQSDYLLGFARRLGEHFSAGGTANLLNFNLAGYHDMSFGLDLGGQARYPGDDLWALKQTLWSFGAVLKNLLPPSLKLLNGKDTLPRELRGGLSLSFNTLSRASLDSGVIRSDRTSVSLSFKKVAGEPGLHPGVGLSYALEKLLVVRLGYDQGISGGIGLHTSDGKFAVDYALENKPLSMNHRFTVSYRFLKAAASANAPSQQEVDEDYAKALARAQSLSEEHYLKGRAYFKDENYDKAIGPLQLASLLDPENKEKADAHRRAVEVNNRERLRKLSDVDAVAPGTEINVYKDLAAALDLRPANRTALIEIMKKLPGRMKPQDFETISQAAVEQRRAEILRLKTVGLTSDALYLIENLEVGQSAASAGAIALLKEQVLSAGGTARAYLEVRAEDARRSGNYGQALRALTAIQRAYPDDRELAGKVESGRREVVSRVSLTLRERLYLRRLYFLAAVRYANHNPEAARDLLEEILRRNAADPDANALEEAMIRNKTTEE